MRKDPFLYLLAFAMDACAGLVGLCVPLVAMGIGADYDDLGAIGASGSVAYSLGCLMSGRLADRLGYRRLMTLASLGRGAGRDRGAGLRGATGCGPGPGRLNPAPSGLPDPADWLDYRRLRRAA